MDSLPGEKTRGREWRRGMLQGVVVGAAALVLLYELHLRFPRQNTTQRLGDEFPDEVPNFVTAMHAAKQVPGPDFTLADVKAEFSDKYGDKAKSLLCSGCRLTASRINDELHRRNATGLPEPAQLLSATMEAVRVACEDMPEHLTIEPGDRRNSFVFEVHDQSAPGGGRLSTIELRKAEVARRATQHMCEVVLHGAKWDMFEALVRHKVPHLKQRGPGPAVDNWERWLCTRHTRVCKRSEVEDDDEDDEGEL